MMEIAQTSKEYFEKILKEHFAHRRAETKDVNSLMDSIEYSLFNGGKRFRPLLCFAVADALGLSKEKVGGFALAVECIHTYSLIHDDLPCMDDDDYRRGELTNHKKFSEDMALLAGDSLLTEAFYILAVYYPDQSAALVRALAEGSGLSGMVRGQVLDLGKGKKVDSLSDLIHLHQLKTGRLISLCFEGPAILGGKKSSEIKELGLMIGLAFQIKDDLLDIEDEDVSSFISFLGEEGTRSHLESLTEKINRQMAHLELDNEFLRSLIDFNLNRDQ